MNWINTIIEEKTIVTCINGNIQMPQTVYQIQTDIHSQLNEISPVENVQKLSTDISIAIATPGGKSKIKNRKKVELKKFSSNDALKKAHSNWDLQYFVKDRNSIQTDCPLRGIAP